MAMQQRCSKHLLPTDAAFLPGPGTNAPGTGCPEGVFIYLRRAAAGANRRAKSRSSKEHVAGHTRRTPHALWRVEKRSMDDPLFHASDERAVLLEKLSEAGKNRRKTRGDVQLFSFRGRVGRLDTDRPGDT